jgi:hypothetical protein
LRRTPPPPGARQILDEIGVDMSAALAGTSAPTRRMAAPAAAAQEGEPALGDDLSARLAQLRN